jgi:MoaD family protein
MKVKVKLFGHFRYITNSKEVELEIKGNTLQEVMDRLIEAYPQLGQAVLVGKDIRPYVNLLLNGKSVKDAGGLASTVKESDDIVLFPPMAGG